MCGITGIFYNNALHDASDVINMSDVIAHRGPDGEGFIAVDTAKAQVIQLGGKKTPISVQPVYSFSSQADLYLAHRRLSIIDLSLAGHQPMSTLSQNTWITYNGEIYNYKALRSELKSHGYSFTSNTDTEVLLYAYEKWGIDCLKKFNGMWAFVLYDKKKNILFGCRDRFGVKPLYYTQQTDFFSFNSEIKGLLAKNSLSKKVNTEASITYLQGGLESFNGETFFSSINELLPAHYFIFDLKTHNLEIKKYYELSFCDTWESFNNKKKDAYVESVREKVLNAVKLRLNADVTVGSCLSGGIDSSTIVCSINKILQTEPISSVGKKQGVVTACYENSTLDESKWAQIVSDTVGAQWYKVFPKKNELQTDLEDLVYSQDVPFGSTSIYAQYRVMKTAKEAGLTVMLDGQGGDELFTGYTPYYKMFYNEAMKNNDYDLLFSEQKNIKNTPFVTMDIIKCIRKEKIKSIIKQYLPETAKDSIRSFLHSPESKYLMAKKKNYSEYQPQTVNQMLWSLMTYSSLPQLLKYEDRNSMRFSIESRTPFADDIELIESVFSIPGSYKIHNGWSKFLLRESMKGIIPEKICSRTDKIGFATPEYEWLQNIKPVVFDSVSDSVSHIINMKKLEKDWDSLFSKQNKTGVTNIWRYINYIIWAHLYKVTV